MKCHLTEWQKETHNSEFFSNPSAFCTSAKWDIIKAFQYHSWEKERERNNEKKNQLEIQIPFKAFHEFLKFNNIFFSTWNGIQLVED